MSYTIGSLAKVAEVPIETIRYYQRRGLVCEPVKPLGGIRRYEESHARRLRFIKRAQVLGFNLDEIADLLALEDGRHCREAEQLGAIKLKTVRERIAQLQRVEQALAGLVDLCHCNTDQVNCPLIATLEQAACGPGAKAGRLAV